MGKISRPGVGGRDEHDHHPRARRRSLLVGVRERRLVPVVAVGDQELAIGERLGDAVAREPPEPRARRRRGPARARERPRAARRRRAGRSARAAPARRAGGAGGPPSARRASARAAARFRVAYGSTRSEATRPSRRRAIPSGPDVVLGDGPDRRLVVLDEHALVEPGPKQPAGLVLGVVQRQVDDVVGVARPVVGERLRRQHVVGRRRHRGRRVRVANRAERGDIGHGPSVPRGPPRLPA